MPKIPSSQSGFIRRILEKTPLTVFDIETSGKKLEDILASGATHAGIILEVGGIKTPGISSKYLEKYQAFVDPRGQKVPIGKEWLEEYAKSEAFTQMHGISTPFPGFTGKIEKVGEVRKKLSAMFPAQGKGLLLGFNLKRFDLPFIQERLGWSPGVSQRGSIIDVMEMAQRALPGLTNYQLPTIATALGIKTRGPMHRALSDSELTLRVFKKLATAKYATKSGLGDVLKQVYGVTSFQQLKEQEYWNKVNQEYWRSREAAGTPKFGGIGQGPRITPVDVSFAGASQVRNIPIFDPDDPSKIVGYTSEQKQAEIEQAAVDRERRSIYSASAEEIAEYERVRAAEEAVFFGEHAPETLKLTQKRAKFWEQISPRGMRQGFMQERLGLTEAQETLLRGGKAGAILRKKFALKMSEFELMGHLPRSEYLGRLPAGGETRIASFGHYADEPGSVFLGMFPQGKSAFIRAEQQKAFISEVFGITKTYRMAGTGALVTPEQMGRIKVVAPQQDVDVLRKYGTKERLRRYIESEIEQELPLARKEAGGWVDVEKATIVDKYAYSVGKPGRRKAPPKLEEEGEVYARMTREAIEQNVPVSEEQAAAIGPGAAEAVAPGVDPWSLTGESTSGLEALKDESKGVYVDLQDISVAYLENKGWHQKRLRDLLEYKKQSFLYEWVKRRGQPRRTRKFKGFTAQFEQAFAAGRARFLAQELDLTGKTPEEIELALEKIKPGANIKVREGGKWKSIVPEDAKLANIYLQDAAETSAQLFSTLKNEIPLRAQAEQVFEIYFSRIKGKRGFGVYTTAGTYLGRTAEALGKKSVPARGYAKIFSWKDKYMLGWAPTKQPFYWSRFGALEQAENEARVKAGLAPIEEVSSLLDIDPSYRLKYDAAIQENLKKMYEQGGEDYKLISKYRLDRATNRQIEIETGNVVDQTVVDAYRSKVERLYTRQFKARERLARMKTKTSRAAGRMDEVLTGKAFAGIGRGKNLVYGAMALSAALVALTAFSGKKRVMSPRDVQRQPYGSTTDDQRMFENRPVNQPTARIVPEYAGRQGYTTNIDVYANDPGGVDHRDLARVMDRHARTTLGVSRGSVSVEVNDNSDRSTERTMRRNYENMLRT